MSELPTPTGWTDATALAAAARVAADSDGIDGTEDAAGAFVTRTRLHAPVWRASIRALVLVDMIATVCLPESLIRTGTTGTKVNDIRTVLITRGGREAD